MRGTQNSAGPATDSHAGRIQQVTPIKEVVFEQTNLRGGGALIARIHGGPRSFSVLIMVVAEGVREQLEADVGALGSYPAAEQFEWLQRLRLTPRYRRLVPRLYHCADAVRRPTRIALGSGPFNVINRKMCEGQSLR